jgi:hypothetical protein
MWNPGEIPTDGGNAIRRSEKFHEALIARSRLHHGKTGNVTLQECDA